MKKLVIVFLLGATLACALLLMAQVTMNTVSYPASQATTSPGYLPFSTSTSGVFGLATLSAVNAETSAYQALATDFSNYKVIAVSSGTFTITLVASTSQPPAGQYIYIVNYGSGTITVARSGQNINGGTSSLSIPAGSATTPTGAWVISDGTNYEAALWGASTGGGISGLTTGVIPQATGSTAIGNSSPQLDNGVTTSNTLTYAGSGGTATPQVVLTGSGPWTVASTPGSCATSASSKGQICISSANNLPVYGYNAGTNYTILTANVGTEQTSVSSETAPSSTSAYTMQGLAGSIIPHSTGTVLIIISGYLTASATTAAYGINIQVSYGTGGAPSNGASLTGTQVGAVQTWKTGTTLTASGDLAAPIMTQALVTGLTVGTTYWIDLAAEAVGAASDYKINNANITAVEL
jgi:hypothetical protein